MQAAHIKADSDPHAFPDPRAYAFALMEPDAIADSRANLHTLSCPYIDHALCRANVHVRTCCVRSNRPRCAPMGSTNGHDVDPAHARTIPPCTRTHHTTVHTHTIMDPQARHTERSTSVPGGTLLGLR